MMRRIALRRDPEAGGEPFYGEHWGDRRGGLGGGPRRDYLAADGMVYCQASVHPSRGSLNALPSLLWASLCPACEPRQFVVERSHC